MAEISAGTVICMGRVEGTVMASKKVEIHSTSKVVGNVKSPALYIELGGVLDGACNMTGKDSKIIPLVKSEGEKDVINFLEVLVMWSNTSNSYARYSAIVENGISKKVAKVIDLYNFIIIW